MTEPGTGRDSNAGWYPDERSRTLLRYWDGTQWTEQTAARPGARSGFPGWAWWVIGGLGLALVLVIAAAVAVPVYLNQQDRAQETAAKLDVSTLGMEIATWYVDNTGVPDVYARGGHYFVDGYDIGPQAENVELGGFTGTGGRDWCVWVTNPESASHDFSYSARAGLQTGRC